MSNTQQALRPTEAEIECVLSASDSYIETLTINTIEAQPWLVELVIKTQLLRAKNPEEKRVAQPNEKAVLCAHAVCVRRRGSEFMRQLWHPMRFRDWIKD